MSLLKGSRTFAANALMSILPILSLTEFQDVLPEGFLPWYALGMVLANMLLRAITTTPLGVKQ